MSKKYCEDFTANTKEGILINSFCKYYNGSKENLESCAYKCGYKDKCLASINGQCVHSIGVENLEEAKECYGTYQEIIKCEILQNSNEVKKD